MNKHLDNVEATLREFAMLSRDAPVLAAVSGGPDSVALLHMLRALDCPVQVAHFDHQTRNGRSAEDAAFVRDLAGRLGLPFHATARDIEALAADSPMSFEEYAREARYAFLVETAKAHACCAIATGHHADDQAETVLMRVLRGTTPRGLAGIPSQTERDGVPIIRPLIRLTRDNIMTYLRERDLAYCHDETNLDIGFLRNRIRHELLPQLRREYNPRLHHALCRLAEVQRAEDDLLSTLTCHFERTCAHDENLIDRAPFAEGDVALQRRLLLELAWAHGAQPDFDHVEGALRFIRDAAAGKRFDLGHGVHLIAERRQVRFAPATPVPPDSTEFRIQVPGEATAFGKRFTISPLPDLPAEPLPAYCSPARQVVDAAALADDVIIRHRRPGDRITPFGLAGSRKLKDYFCDLGVPPAERDEKLLVTTGDDILWIVGHAVSAKAAVTDTTTKFLQIEVADAAE